MSAAVATTAALGVAGIGAGVAAAPLDLEALRGATILSPEQRILAVADAGAAEPIMLPYQAAWIEDQSRLKIWEKSRRIGADWCEAFWVAYSRLSGKRRLDYLYSSRDQDAAREFMEYIAVWLRVWRAGVEILTDEVRGDDGVDIRVYRIDFAADEHGPACKVLAMSSSPNAVRSRGGDVTISEYAFAERPGELWKAAKPAIQRGGRLAIISTHNGEGNDFNRKLQGAMRIARGEKKPFDIPFNVHRTTIDDAIADGLVERINLCTGESLTREQWRQREYDECGDARVWDEEYLCRPSDEDSSLLPFELLRPCVTQRTAATTDSVEALLADVQELGSGCEALYAGMDVARVHDRFVLWVNARFGAVLRTVGLLVWQGRDFADMRAAAEALMRFEGVTRDADGRHLGRFRVRRLCVDATGMGMPVAEHLVNRFRRRVEAVTFTAASKEELALGLLGRVQEKTVELPDDAEVLGDLNSVRRQHTAAGNVRYQGERTAAGHADRFWGCALAVHACDDAPSVTTRFHAKKPRGL
ncbi:MAG: hypothetical protein H6826_14375 [Planctomycetes bacterium]|nr:hypothetical protein [Planctomycetota bacterium]